MAQIGQFPKILPKFALLYSKFGLSGKKMMRGDRKIKYIVYLYLVSSGVLFFGQYILLPYDAYPYMSITSPWYEIVDFYLAVLCMALPIIPILACSGVCIASLLAPAPTRRNQAPTRLRSRATVTVLLFTLVYLACNIPVFMCIARYAVLSLWHVDFLGSGPDVFLLRYFWPITYISLVQVNSLLNPFVYLYRMCEFRYSVVGTLGGGSKPRPASQRTVVRFAGGQVQTAQVVWRERNGDTSSGQRFTSVGAETQVGGERRESVQAGVVHRLSGRDKATQNTAGAGPENEKLVSPTDEIISMVKPEITKFSCPKVSKVELTSSVLVFEGTITAAKVDIGGMSQQTVNRDNLGFFKLSEK